MFNEVPLSGPTRLSLHQQMEKRSVCLFCLIRSERAWRGAAWSGGCGYSGRGCSQRRAACLLAHLGAQVHVYDAGTIYPVDLIATIES